MSDEAGAWHKKKIDWRFWSALTTRELRKRYGFTQAAFADYFGFPLRTVASWESESDSGRTCPAQLVALIAYKLEKEFPEK